VKAKMSEYLGAIAFIVASVIWKIFVSVLSFLGSVFSIVLGFAFLIGILVIVETIMFDLRM